MTKFCGADIIDSRDIIERIECLTESGTLTDDERDELTALTKFADDLEGYGDWVNGETLIRDGYFETYTEELAGDIGVIPSEDTWPLYCIDWEWAATELQIDYTYAELNGEKYWMRA